MMNNFLKKLLASLGTVMLMAGSAHAVDVTVTGALNGGSPTFNRPSNHQSGPNYLASANTGLPYAVTEVKTGSVGGTVTLTVGAGTEFDSFLALYSSFDPENPLSNVLVADDDGAGYPHAKIVAGGLAANTSYYLVITSYSSNADGAYPLYGNYSLTLSGDLTGYAISAAASPVAGGTVSCTPATVMQGGSSTCTATANIGYTFTGFSGDCTGASCALSNISSAKSVVANFALNSYAITATASPVAGGTVGCTSNPVNHGDSSTCTAVANAGYTFTGFSGDCSGATCTLSNVTAARNVTASFAQNSYAVTATASPVAGGTVSCTPNPVTHGSNSTCIATANAGYTFGSFSGDCAGATCTLSNVTAARSVTASFTQNTYAVTATASPVAGGTVSCTPNPVPHGSSATCTATPSVNYAFGVFSGDCTGATCTLSNVTAVKSITASFVANTAPVASNVTLSGTAQVGSTLTGAYTYSDAESDPQGVSTYRWMADTQASGVSKTVLAGATTPTYGLGVDVLGKYVFFCVTPVASAGLTTGVEVCSDASAAIAAEPEIVPLLPNLGGNPVQALITAPTLLNVSGSTGLTVVGGAANVVQQLLKTGVQYGGQTAGGSVVLTTPTGTNIVFAPLSVQTNDPRPDGLYPTGNGQYQIVSAGTALLVAPAVQNLVELIGLLPAGASARMESNGVLSAKVGGLVYVVQPSVFAQLQANPGGVPTLTTGADGFLHFTDAAGNSQILYPAFREADVALRLLQSIDPKATLSIQMDGTAKVQLQGKDMVLVPDLTLGGVPPGMEGTYWWQEGPGRYRVRIQANWYEYQSQGLTLQ